MATARITLQGVEVLYIETPPASINARLTFQGSEVLYVEPLPSPTYARVTQQGVEVIYVDPRKIFYSDITCNAYLSADLSIIDGNAVRLTQQAVEVVYTLGVNPTARVTGVFVEVIHTTASLAGALTAAIESNAVVTANLSFSGNTQLAVDFTGTGTLYAELAPILRPGNTLQLTQTVTTSHILIESVSDTLTLTQDLPNGAGKGISASASNTLLITQSAVGGKNKSGSASSTLVLSHAVFESRPVSSVLNLTQNLSGGIFYYPGIAYSELLLTHNVDVDAKAQFTVNFSGTGQLQVNINKKGDASMISTLLLNQIAIGTLLQEFMTLQSPFEGPETIIALPKPLVGNTENIVSDMLLKKSMNGVKRTYIKTNRNRRLTYTLSMTRDKGLELENFFKLHNGHTMRLTTWEAEIWRVNLITNPLDFNQPRRGAVCGPQVEIDLEFEGVKLSG
jgi:hypothetical protein